MSDTKPANSLEHSASAYLRSAAHQPVEWYEWGDTAFQKAQQEDKPILLDIGAVWCHWCHVMDRESYEQKEIARLINEHYVPVKVDRDERPDIDARYQLAVSALTGQGGWPLTAFLTPAGKPFYGGTYFPPDDNFGRPGMKRVLASIAQNYQAHKAEIFSSADQIAAALAGAESFQKSPGGADRKIVDAVISSIGRMFDPQHGGFGNAPKFPHPGALDLLLDAYLETRQAWLLSVVTTTLEGMARGGVYDQIGGGFHRYSVDERWIVPHFEKMSYDNAGLLGNFLSAYQASRSEQMRLIAAGIVTFVHDILSAPGGGFYASQDADAGLEDDGDYFTWTLDEVKAVLDDTEAAVVRERYHIEPRGEMHHNPAKNVLFIDQPFEAIAARVKIAPEEVPQILARAQAKMLAARRKRPTPFVDTTLYAAWNGMMISALLEAYKILDDDAARASALQALDLMLAKAYDPSKGMYHSLVGGQARIEGLLDDQVFMIAALLDAFEVTGRRVYFDRALELAEITVRRFWDDADGGFFDTAKDLDGRQGNLQLQRKAFQDSPTPAGNSIAIVVLDHLAVLAERPDFREKAQATLDLFASKASDFGLYAATYALALAQHLRPPVEVVVVGEAGDERTKKLLRAAYDAPRAGKRVFSFEPSVLDLKSSVSNPESSISNLQSPISTSALPPGLAATLPNVPYQGRPLALVCVGNTCQPPTSDPEELARALAAQK
jgi:uncharacterized protein